MRFPEARQGMGQLEVLRWGPPQLQEAVDHFAGSLRHGTRWILFTYWSTDLWGEATPGGQSVGDTKLALCAHMAPGENVVASFAASCLPALEAACYRAMTA
jgi:hypothetical protein